MYPFLRMGWAIWSGGRAAPLPLLGTHVSRHLCWPWDIDPWMELNNGRALTLFDFGRVGMGRRMGIDGVLRREGWGLTVAGASSRYRRRVRAFERLVMTTRCLGWDARFLYMEQALWKGSDCAVHMLLRAAVVAREGLVDPVRLARALGHEGENPALPDWVLAWIAADAGRPWPPGAVPVAG